MNNGWNGNTEFKMKSEILLHDPVLKMKLFSLKLTKKWILFIVTQLVLGKKGVEIQDPISSDFLNSRNWKREM